MALSPAQRRERIDQYERGPLRLKAALLLLPDRAIQWRPGVGGWSAHEVICYCADAETAAAAHLRYLLVEKEPNLLGHDPEEWARRLHYHAHPLEPALETVEAVRANTTALLRRLPEPDWSREGRHSQSGLLTVDDWLTAHADQLERHARRIERNLEAWRETAETV